MEKKKVLKKNVLFFKEFVKCKRKESKVVGIRFLFGWLQLTDLY